MENSTKVDRIGERKDRAGFTTPEKPPECCGTCGYAHNKPYNTHQKWCRALKFVIYKKYLGSKCHLWRENADY